MPQRGAVTPTEAVAWGYVKWYNPEKGFGFVALEDGTDVFLHGSVLARGGFSINPGDTVRVGVGKGVKGQQVTEILEVKATANQAERPTSTAGSVRGVVKWWNEQKGFGFVTPDVGTKDIFVRASIAARSSLNLQQGVRVKVKIRQGAKGPEAAEIALA